MSRPEFITLEDISRWSQIIDSDPLIPTSLSQVSLIREVCYAGLWLSEQLENLGCDTTLAVRIQFTAGKLSFGRDPWEVHQDILQRYTNNTLEYDTEPNMEELLPN